MTMTNYREDDMSHEHVCRDCGDGYDCDGQLSRDGQCHDFDGYCEDCAYFIDMHNGEQTLAETAANDSVGPLGNFAWS